MSILGFILTLNDRQRPRPCQNAVLDIVRLCLLMDQSNDEAEITAFVPKCKT